MFLYHQVTAMLPLSSAFYWFWTIQVIAGDDEPGASLYHSCPKLTWNRHSLIDINDCLSCRRLANCSRFIKWTQPSKGWMHKFSNLLRTDLYIRFSFSSQDTLKYTTIMHRCLLAHLNSWSVLCVELYEGDDELETSSFCMTPLLLLLCLSIIVSVTVRSVIRNLFHWRETCLKNFLQSNDQKASFWLSYIVEQKLSTHHGNVKVRSQLLMT